MWRKRRVREAAGIKAWSRWPNHKHTYRHHSSSPPLPPSLFFHYLLFDVFLINQPHSYSFTVCIARSIFPTSNWLSIACLKKILTMREPTKSFWGIRHVCNKLNDPLYFHRQTDVFILLKWTLPGSRRVFDEFWGIKSTSYHLSFKNHELGVCLSTQCVFVCVYLRGLVDWLWNTLPLSRPEDNCKVGQWASSTKHSHDFPLLEDSVWRGWL